MNTNSIQKGYEVEWISDRGKQSENDFNPDLCIYSYRDFPTLAKAKAFAKTVKSPQVNAAWIQAFELEKEFDGWHRVYSGDRIEVECQFKP